MRRLLMALALIGGAPPAVAQQAAHRGADVSVARPTWTQGRGPVVAVDHGHNNFHMIDGRYGPFAGVLRSDGYRVVPLPGAITPAALKDAAVLVIANPLARENVETWRLPTPSAYTAGEIETLRAWVDEGGSLFLIADHMPFPGAVQSLAAAFGFTFDNAFTQAPDTRAPELFSRETGTLGDHAITRDSPVRQVRSFTGSSFRAPPGAVPLMSLGPGWTVRSPVEAWKFPPDTPERPASREDLRGAVLEYGKGRLAVFSEAAMFTAQTQGGGAPFGFAATGAEQNKQFLLNVMHWLSGVRP